jgi:hypothetical protein
VKRVFLFVLVFVMALSACAKGPSQEEKVQTQVAATMAAASPTPKPSHTPTITLTSTSTSTPAPTNTPTPVPSDTPTATFTPAPTNTPTPDLAATEAFKATEIADVILAEVKADLEKVKVDPATGRLGWVQTEAEAIKMDTAWESLYTPFAEDLVASDFVIKTDITWEASGGMMTCGFIFRSEANFETGSQYLFQYLRLSGLPAWDIEYWKNGDPINNVIGELKFADAIKMDNGATNKFIMIVEGNKFTLHINGRRIGSFYDWSSYRAEGRFAFFGSEEAGESSCTFENTWIWLLK